MNDRQLVVAMVRSLLTTNPGSVSRKYVAAIVWPTLRFLLDWNQTPDLRISPDCPKVLRDFSLTTRIGELAQGVSFAYWKWQRGYAWITDFNPFAKSLLPAYAGSKFPDFVMLNLKCNDLAVMEAKGTGSHCHKKQMTKARRQCRDAESHPAFNRGFGSILTLDVANPSGIGSLHIRDPESRGDHSAGLRHAIFRRSYATWFELAGEEETASWCRKQNIDEKASDYPIRDDGRRGASDTLRKMTAMALGFDPSKVRFTVASEVLEALSSFEVFTGMEWFQHLQQRLLRYGDDDRQIIFPDGTVISSD
jgi:hypothetical protein